MRGIVRPCRSHLGPALHARWQAHLCGLCLTLRDVAGQPERALTGYDVLLLSVLVEGQSGRVETTTAEPCPLRGFTTATVVASTSGAGRLAAAGALLTGAAGLDDKLQDGDLPWPTRAPARHAATRLRGAGTALAAGVALDPSAVLAAPAASARAELAESPSLPSLLAPTGEAVASLFAHTALVAARPDNAPALADCGRAFGQLVHLLDAVQDLQADAAAGRFNPLQATGTEADAARRLADALVAEVADALARTELEDPALLQVLLGRELVSAVHRVLPPPVPSVPAQRGSAVGVLAPLLALWALLTQTIIIGGGSWSSGGRRRRSRRGYAQGYGRPPGYGYRRSGPGCGQLLACNCCANLACNACCCGNQCANN